jgi:catechol 2,3-dioxygenase-like lactoylglutathione lyase family enzyme
MEHIIAKLLQDFENGKLTRRQLIESLALGVTAASAAVAAPAPAAGGKALKAVAVNHISYQVADYAPTRDFYQDLFGMKLLKDDGKLALLSFGNTFIIPRTKNVTEPRVDHIAYTIDKWDKKAVEDELKRRGLNPKLDTDYSFHIADPNGFDVQISSREMDGIKA